MIKSKDDYNMYMCMDAQALGKKNKKIVLLGNEIWRFERALRHYEYHLNVTHNRVLILLWKLIYRSLSYKLGFEIPPNTFGGGLRINHYGNIVVNPEAKIGEWCDIHQGVNIGTGFDGGVPEIGDNVWIGPGAKLYGKIKIASGSAIGANAVVNKSFNEKGTIVGVPAKKISEKGNIYIRKLEEVN